MACSRYVLALAFTMASTPGSSMAAALARLQVGITLGLSLLGAQHHECIHHADLAVLIVLSSPTTDDSVGTGFTCACRPGPPNSSPVAATARKLRIRRTAGNFVIDALTVAPMKRSTGSPT